MRIALRYAAGPVSVACAAVMIAAATASAMAEPQPAAPPTHRSPAPITGCSGGGTWGGDFVSAWKVLEEFAWDGMPRVTRDDS